MVVIKIRKINMQQRICDCSKDIGGCFCEINNNDENKPRRAKDSQRSDKKS